MMNIQQNKDNNLKYESDIKKDENKDNKNITESKKEEEKIEYFTE